MVCLGTYPYGSCRIVPIYKKNRIHPMKLQGTIYMSLLSGCLKPSSYPLPRVIHLSSFFLFSHKDKRTNFLPLLFGCLKPFLLPSSNRNTLVFVFNIPMKMKGRISVPSTKNSFTISSPRNIEWELKMNDLITLGREEGE